jgi:hypothetical protein
VETPARPRSAGRIAEGALLACAGLVFAALIRYHWHHICDDAFIAFRYADHLVAGAGPVWNTGEAVEGFSSPLWLALLALGRALGAALPAWAGAWGAAFGVLCLILVHRLALALSGGRVVAAATTAAVCLLHPLYYWAPAGLETTMFAAVVTGVAWALAGTAIWAWAPVAALLGVARPEGPFLAVALPALVWLVHGRAALRPRWVALAFGPAAAWELFRIIYYGAWLPNTYYAKATGDLLARLTAGTVYSVWGLAAWAAAAVAAFVSGVAQRKVVAVLAWAGLGLAAVMLEGGDWMWHGRMLLPILPMLAALSVTAVAASRARHRVVLVLVCVLAWSGLLPRREIIVDAFSGGRLPPPAYQEGTLVAASLSAAAFIAERYPAEALVAVNHAGALPYALPNPALDMAGLCDRHIAREVAGGLHRKLDPGYVLSRRPRLVVLNSRVRPGTAGIWYHPGYWVGETALFVHPDFASLYRPVPRFWSWQWRGQGSGGYVLLYERAPTHSGD